MRVKTADKNKYDAIILFSTSVATLLVFLSGLGRYRVILLFFIFFLLRAVFSYFKLSSTGLYLLLLPVLLIVLPLDIKYGQFLPLFPNLHFIISITFLIVVELLARSCTVGILRRLTNKEIFRVCPECMYDNRNLVDECASCNYKSSSSDSIVEQRSPVSGIKLANDIKKEIDKNTKLGLLKKPSGKILKSLRLEVDENILVNIKIFPNRSFFKNGVREVGGNFVMTTKRIVFIGFSFLGGGWRFKEIIHYDQLSDIRVEMKQLVTKKEPVIVFKTIDNVYELYFKSLLPFRNKINGIIDCLRKNNASVPITIDLPDNQHKINLEW